MPCKSEDLSPSLSPQVNLIETPKKANDVSIKINEIGQSRIF